MYLSWGGDLLKAWRTVVTALSPQMGKRPQKTVQITGTMSVSCPSLNAGGGWETGKVRRSRQANGRLKLLLILKAKRSSE